MVKRTLLLATLIYFATHNNKTILFFRQKKRSPKLKLTSVTWSKQSVTRPLHWRSPTPDLRPGPTDPTWSCAETRYRRFRAAECKNWGEVHTLHRFQTKDFILFFIRHNSMIYRM